MSSHRRPGVLARALRLRRPPKAAILAPRRPGIELVDAGTGVRHRVSSDEPLAGRPRGDYQALRGARLLAARYRRPLVYHCHDFADGSCPLHAGGRLVKAFEQAMARFHDATGLPGPRGWSGGAPPAGRENHPVVDVTWYEAEAFAEWKGKKLPTIYQWEKAARYPVASQTLSAYPWGAVSEGIDATERANFQGRDTMAVDTMPFGASPFGAQHMAGNVSEWCRNVDPPGYAARGGSYKDAIYAFGQTAAFPGFYSAPTLGFRCVSGGGGDEGDFALNPSGFVPAYQPVDDRTFEEFRRRYDYAKTPLYARVVEHVETPDWTREKITYVVAGQTVPAYLYLPKGFRPPLQVIHFAPAGDVVSGERTLSHSIEAHLAPLIRAGRAVFSIELEGFLGRPHPRGWVAPDFTQDEYVDSNVTRVTEMRRGLDYLQTRSEIDKEKIGVTGMSMGATRSWWLMALDERLKTGVAVACLTRYENLIQHEQLKAHGKVVRGWLGVEIQEVTPDLAKSFGLSMPSGALVAGVESDGPAAKAGIERGDIIAKFNGETVHDEHELPEMVAATPIGKQVPIEVIRNGKHVTLDATSAVLKEQQIASAENPGEAGASWGLQVRDMTPELAQQLGLHNSKGVVVTGVKQDSPAADANLQQGDQILEINHKKINSADEFATLARDAQKNKSQALLLVQRGSATLYTVINPQG